MEYQNRKGLVVFRGPDSSPQTRLPRSYPTACGWGIQNIIIRMLNVDYKSISKIKPFVTLYGYFWRHKSGANDSTLLIWRKRIFTNIFLCALVTAAFSYIPNLKHAIQTGQWIHAIIFTAAYLVLLSVVTVSIFPFKARAWIGLLIFYGIGLMSSLALGPVGGGRMFLFAFALMASLLLGLKAGIIALILNIATFLSIGWGLSEGHLRWPHLTNYTFEMWATAGYTFFFFNIVVTVSIGVLVNALEKNLQKEQSLSRELKLSNEKLERENIERRQSEKALKDSEEKYKTLTNNLHVGIYRNTVGPEGRFLEANPAMLAMFGYKDRQDFLNINVSDLYQNPENRKIVNEKLLQKGSVRNEELQLKKKNGSNIVCSVSAVAVRKENGDVKYYDGFIEDITERRLLESQLQQAQKMEAIGTLAGGVAHDLNNILSGMVSYPELLLMDLPDRSPLEQPLLTIQQSGQKAAAIVQDLLTLARRGVSVREVVDFNQMIEQYLNSPEHQKILEYHPGVKVTVNLDSDLPKIVGSPVHLSKTIMNMVSNAAEAMPDGGRIDIVTETRHIPNSSMGIETVEGGDYVILTVSDSGIGISHEDIARIFEPFYTKKNHGKKRHWFGDGGSVGNRQRP